MGETIYQKLGAENLEKMVNKFYELVEQDDRINHLFKNDFNLIKQKQLMFLTQFLGGPQLYIQEYGHPRMRMRHMPHAITPAAAEAWLENMQQAIQSLPIEEEFKENIFNTFPKLAAHMINQ